MHQCDGVLLLTLENGKKLLFQISKKVKNMCARGGFFFIQTNSQNFFQRKIDPWILLVVNGARSRIVYTAFKYAVERSLFD